MGVSMSHIAITPAQRAEQMGGSIACALLDGLLNAENHADALDLIRMALLSLLDLRKPKHAMAGFAVALTPVIERGMGLDEPMPEDV